MDSACCHRTRARETVTIKINCRRRFGSRGVLFAIGARGPRQSRRVSVDVKTVGSPRVPERAGHVQRAREATSVGLRHTYATRVLGIIYNMFIYYISLY